MKIKYFLDRNSLIQIPSKTTPSVYYYFKYSSVRYSNHFTPEKTGCGQIQVIRTSKRVFILIPGESEYRILNEKTGFYLLRKLLKSDLRKKSGSSKEKQYKKFIYGNQRYGCEYCDGLSNRLFKNDDGWLNISLGINKKEKKLIMQSI